MDWVDIGSVVGGRFELVAPLGAGGMGTVYRARDRQLDVDVAVKVLRLGDDANAVRRFHSEVRLARLVKHPNVCSVHEYGESEGLVYCVMELVEGRNLRELLRERPIAWERAHAVALEIAKGLKAIHDAGIVHRDLKSSNVMIDGQGRVRLVDFGIARPQPGRAGHPQDGELTDSRHVVGSPEYMSPEQVRHGELDARSDIYSFGIVLFELFTGRVPFKGDTPYEVMTAQLKEPPPLDGPALKALPEPIVAVLRRALEKDPARRWQDTGKLIAALRAAQASPMDTDSLSGPAEPPRARTVSVFLMSAAERLADALTRGAVGSLVLLGVVALGAGVFYLVRGGGGDVPPTTPTTTATAASGASGLPPAPSASPSPAPVPTAEAQRPPAAPDRTLGAKPSASVAPTAARRLGAAATTTTTTVAAPVPTPAPTPTPTALPTPTPPPPLIPTATTTTTTTTTRPPEPSEVSRADCRGQPVRLTSQAERLGLRGRVTLECTVSEDGTVHDARVVSADHPALAKSALDSVARWRCRPATDRGVPVRMRLLIPLEFR